MVSIFYFEVMPHIYFPVDFSFFGDKIFSAFYGKYYLHIYLGVGVCTFLQRDCPDGIIFTKFSLPFLNGVFSLLTITN